MSKVREPRTFAAAITRVMGAVSDEECGAAVGKSSSLVRKWADPDHACLPNLEQALALDAAYVNAGCGSAPILAVYGNLLKEISEPPAGTRTVKDCALAMQAGIGMFSQTLLLALAPDSQDGILLSAAERQEVFAILESIKDQLSATEMALSRAATGLALSRTDTNKAPPDT